MDREGRVVTMDREITLDDARDTRIVIHDTDGLVIPLTRGGPTTTEVRLRKLILQQQASLDALLDRMGANV